MRADEITTICDAVALEGPETVSLALQSVKRMSLVNSIRDLRNKAQGYVGLADRLERDLETVEGQIKNELSTGVDF